MPVNSSIVGRLSGGAIIRETKTVRMQANDDIGLPIADRPHLWDHVKHRDAQSSHYWGLDLAQALPIGRNGTG
ncbi:MAG: hypothetical protein QM753_01975 [Thermomicrobiales bacterium]